MTNRTRLLHFSLALLAGCASLAHAAQPTEVSVAGRIKPLAPNCFVHAPAEVQYGVIPLEKINVDGVTLLDKKAFSFRISCNKGAKFTVQFVDTRHGTAADDPAFLADVAQALPGNGPDHAFGLSLDSTGRKIGAMFLKISRALYQGAPGVTYAKPFYQDGERWVREEGDRVRYQARYAFAREDAVEPISLYDLHADVEMVPVLDSGRLDLTKKIDVSGKITLEISQI
jgi:hypothetical protein